MKIKIGKITSKDIFNREKPRFNGYACGHGPHGDKKYNRNKVKRDRDKYQY